jgi:hypothetical protein
MMKDRTGVSAKPSLIFSALEKYQAEITYSSRNHLPGRNDLQDASDRRYETEDES